MKITREQFDEIFDKTEAKWTVDNAFQGFCIIAKYEPDAIIIGAEHDIVFGPAVDKIIATGLTEEDAIVLRKLNWMVEYDSLACFV